MSSKVVLITGASSGFGRLAARALADAGHIVYASMRDVAGRNVAAAREVADYARERGVALRALDLDVAVDSSVTAAMRSILAENGHIDVVVHNAGHMAYGPAEAFTPEQLAELYDVNVLSTQRVNRAALPAMRARREGLLVWVSSSSTRGGTPPYLSPYFAAKAAMDSLAVSYAAELARWGIETTIVVPGAFTRGTNHFAHAGAPRDLDRAKDYERGPTSKVAEVALAGLSALVPSDADPADVARAIVEVVDARFGHRPFRVHVDPAKDGAEVVNAVADRVRAEFLRNIGLGDLLAPRAAEAASASAEAERS